MTDRAPAVLSAEFLRRCWPVVEPEQSLRSLVAWLRDAGQFEAVLLVVEVSADGVQSAGMETWQVHASSSSESVELHPSTAGTPTFDDLLDEWSSRPGLACSRYELGDGQLYRARVGLVDGEAGPDGQPESEDGWVRNDAHAGLLSSVELQLQQIAVIVTRHLTEHHCAAIRDARLEAMAEFAAGAGHEINNPLGTIRGRAELLLRDEVDPERRRSLATIGAQVDRVRDMIGDAMLFARPPQPRPIALSVGDLVVKELAAWRQRFEDVSCDIVTVGLSESLMVRADPDQFLIVLRSLLRNSVESCGAKGQIECEIRRAGASGSVSIRDNGAGLTELQRLHAFDPFYSGREAGRGLGFGLAKCWRIVTAHGGKVLLESHPDWGCVITTLWPLA